MNKELNYGGGGRVDLVFKKRQKIIYFYLMQVNACLEKNWDTNSMFQNFTLYSKNAVSNKFKEVTKNSNKEQENILTRKNLLGNLIIGGGRKRQGIGRNGGRTGLELAIGYHPLTIESNVFNLIQSSLNLI